MGNQSSNIYSEAVESDLNFLDLSCESFFNIDYLSSISAQIPEYEEFIGKDTRSTLESTSKSLDGYYIRSLFSNSLMPCLSKKVDISRQSSSELSPINRIRHRLMYRIREVSFLFSFFTPIFKHYCRHICDMICLPHLIEKG